MAKEKKKSCELCSADANQYDPACLSCGGRYLRAIQRHPKRSREWLAKALADWVAQGHPEDVLRELARSPSSSPARR
jgi:predicted amidophosphoribosyltransferase